MTLDDYINKLLGMLTIQLPTWEVSIDNVCNLDSILQKDIERKKYAFVVYAGPLPSIDMLEQSQIVQSVHLYLFAPPNSDGTNYDAVREINEASNKAFLVSGYPKATNNIPAPTWQVASFGETIPLQDTGYIARVVYYEIVLTEPGVEDDSDPSFSQ